MNSLPHHAASHIVVLQHYLYVNETVWNHKAFRLYNSDKALVYSIHL